MGNEVIYRQIEKSDFTAIKKILNESFDLYKFVPNIELLDCFSSAYLYSCLAESTFSLVAEENGKIIGVINGNASKDYSFFKHLPFIFNSLKYGFRMKKLCKKHNIKAKEQRLMDKIYIQFLKDSPHSYDGILTLFAVSEDCRGKGVGTQLLNKLMEYYDENKVKRIYLFTDSSCNYAFYENRGFVRQQTKSMSLNRAGELFDMNVFFYDLVLSRNVYK